MHLTPSLVLMAAVLPYLQALPVGPSATPSLLVRRQAEAIVLGKAAGGWKDKLPGWLGGKKREKFGLGEAPLTTASMHNGEHYDPRYGHGEHFDHYESVYGKAHSPEHSPFNSPRYGTVDEKIPQGRVNLEEYEKGLTKAGKTSFGQIAGVSVLSLGVGGTVGYGLHAAIHPGQASYLPASQNDPNQGGQGQGQPQGQPQGGHGAH